MHDMRIQAGGAVDPKRSYKSNVWVYGCVRAINNNLNGIPWHVRNKRTKKIVPESDPWFRLLTNPNPLLECMQHWKMHTILLETKGECFWLLYGPGMKPVDMFKVPDSIWVYGPDRVTANIDENTNAFLGWKFKPRMDREDYITFQPWQVLRFFDVDPDNLFKGMSPIEPATQSITVMGKAMGFNDAYLDNGAKVDGVITISPEDFQSLGEDGLEEMREKFDDRHAGYGKNGRTPIIAGGDFKPTGNGPKDMDFKGLSEFCREEVTGAFGVPGHQVGLTKNLNMATATEETKLFYTNNIIPKARYYASVINNRLLLGTDLEFYFDEHSIKPLQENMDSKVKNADTLVNQLGYAPNEVNRKLELGMEDIKETWAEEAVDPRSLNMPPPPPDEVEEEDPDKKPKKSAPTVKSKRNYAEEYWYDVIRPVETRMVHKIISYWMRLKKDQLKRWDAKYGKDAKAVLKMSDDDLREVLFESERWDSKLREESYPYHQQAFNNSISYLREEVDTFYRFKPGSSKVTELLKEKNSRITQVNDRFKAELLSSLSEGVAAGENVAQLRERIVTDFGEKIATANTIARTETAQASGMIRHYAMEEEDLLKEWLDSGNSTVRGTHKKYGRIGPVELDYEYAPGLKFPGDPDCDDAAEICNCVCVEKAVRRPVES